MRKKATKTKATKKETKKAAKKLPEKAIKKPTPKIIPPKPASTHTSRPPKEPPPQKIWRIEGIAPEGLTVTLGRYLTKEETVPELNRLRDEDFYQKLRTVKDPEIKSKTG